MMNKSELSSQIPPFIHGPGTLTHCILHEINIAHTSFQIEYTARDKADGDPRFEMIV